ncbi:lutropin-choriogonadotropic hormone receptor [Calliphora vicina]|uniref:lutropin-choriogonadotropic hormone receptor n=1 Tax=Calliphora vicina TaxID=7373 RepID=UPI00325AC086
MSSLKQKKQQQELQSLPVNSNMWQHHQYYYFYKRQQQQQQHQRQHQKQQRQHHRHFYHQQHQNYCLAKIPKMQQQLQMPAYQMLRFLLLLVCYCCHSQASMEYSAKLSNCYDNQYGFNGHHIYNATTAAVTAANNTATTSSSNVTTIIAPSNNSGQFAQSLANTGAGVMKNNEADEIISRGAFQHSSSVRGWKCCCWNATSLDEIECRCEGEALTRVPQTLTIPLQRLTIASAGLPRLRNTGLKVYNASLLDIVLTDLKYLETIQDGAFASLKLLRTIYISHAPKLTYLSKDVFEGISDTIKIIRIINSGLTKIPDLIHLPTTHILQMIDLDNNHITHIESKSINIKTDQLILANNDISYIDDSAFQGSLIAKLILKENPNLQQVHPKAFHGMSMQELDLSSTSLVRLPSAGLLDIEVLRIENTHTLKTIPSIYNFKNLQKAYLTHSFHCCAFKFPSRHDPRRHAERLKEIEKWQQQCNNKNDNNNNNVNENSNMKSKQSNKRLKNPKFNTEHEGGDVDTKSGEAPEDTGVWSTPTTDGGDKSVEQNTDGVAYGNRGFGSFAGTGFGLIYEPSSQQQLSSATHSMTAAADDGVAGNREKLNLLSNANSILYSRLMRSDFSISQEELQNESNVWAHVSKPDVEYFVEEDYMSDSMKELFGKFHEPIEPDESQLDEYCGNFTFRKHDVECYPIPNALNPCEDVMGYQWLRTSVWIVVGLAVIGNVAVLVVILSIKAETPSVPRFLMCHLAFADLCLGLYLLLIASIDAHSMGEYFNYAYDWQYGAGCKVAGFLTVFASHLSVFTLTVITIERWLAITHAMYLNHRIKIRPAAYIMIGGWIYSVVMSLLPLFGISNYSSTSICLPMENRDPFDTVYLVAIMGLNGSAFFIIAICYGQIYLSLGEETRHAHSNSRGEMSVAKKMALLVFTNFACWAPIAFFALTALAGYPLINVTKSKILLVFFYPLNSCADPYLYAILTSQYRQDLYTLLAKFGLCKQKALKYKNSISFPGTTNFTCSVQRGSLIPKTQQSITPPESQMMLKNKEDFV